MSRVAQRKRKAFDDGPRYTNLIDRGVGDGEVGESVSVRWHGCLEDPAGEESARGEGRAKVRPARAFLFRGYGGKEQWFWVLALRTRPPSRNSGRRRKEKLGRYGESLGPNESSVLGDVVCTE